MPIIHDKDKSGAFFKYGPTGKKYYYTKNNPVSMYIAKYKAKKQGQAIEISKSKRN